MKRNLGHTLVELLLVAGVITAATGVIFSVYRSVAAAGRQEQALAAAVEVIENVQNAFASHPNYRHLSQDLAYQQGLFGPDARLEQGRVLLPQLGEVMLSPVDVSIQGQTVNSGGFQLIFQSMPSQLCIPVGQALAQTATEMEVGDQKVRVDNQGVDTSELTQACSQPSEVRVAATFVNSGANEELVSCVAPDTHQEQTVGCPAGQTGTQLQRRDGHCPGPYGPVQWSAWTTIASHCTQCPPPESQTQPCLPGEYGQRQARREFNCAEKQWGPWVVLADTCQRCPTEPQTRQIPCPGSSGGFIHEERRFICLEGQWGPWAVRENQCTA